MRIIQIRGNNGTGKTTLVRRFISGKKYRIITFYVLGRQIECTKIDDIIILGRYDQNECGGCDSAVKNAEELKILLGKVTNKEKPKTIIFEGVMYGKTFSLSYEIHKYCKAIGADYIALCLIADFETTLERIYRRNGGKKVNVENLHSSWKSSIRSNNKLKQAGVNVIKINTCTATKEEIDRRFQEIINTGRP